MPSGIDDFKQNVVARVGLSRPSRYYVAFWDTGLSFGGDSPQMEQYIDNIEDLYQPETVILPSRSLAAIQEHFHGPAHNVPCGRVFDSSLVMTFPLSEGSRERSFFEAWMDSLVDSELNIANGSNAGRGNIYNNNLTVFTMSGSSVDQYTAAYVFTDCYPISIFPVNYGFNMVNDYARLQVQFEYRDYKYAGAGYLSSSVGNLIDTGGDLSGLADPDNS